MNLAIDIGNTNSKFALFEKKELKEVFTDPGKLQEILIGSKVKRAIISKTGSNGEVEQLLQEKKVKTLFLAADLKLPVKILYKTPETLGADRIAGAVAAHAAFPNENVLKIDFGTCITYDIVTAENNYPGGAISPGMMMRFRAMNSYTAKLPLIDPMQYSAYALTGTDTAGSMLSGVIHGIKHEVNGIIKEYEDRLGRLKVVTTGGDAALFATLIKSEIFARPYLVLEGLNEILNFNS
ncbi:MAG: type III pantothenate kinase [Chitinophagales bacterium]